MSEKQKYHVRIDVDNLPSGKAREYMNQVKADLEEVFPEYIWIVTSSRVQIEILP